MNEQQPTVQQLQTELERIRKVNITFLKKVAKMRELQRDYFKTRDHSVLVQSKALETEVDNYLTRCLDALASIDFNEKVQILTDKFDAQQV